MKILIANRSEIAIRIHRAAASMGIDTVGVFTVEDRMAKHARMVDEAHLLSGRDGYLDAAQLVALAVRNGCGLLHPGYGFLSESIDLAQRCESAGVVFVGPRPEALALLGDKPAARAHATRLGVPVLRATEASASIETAGEFLDAMGPGGAVVIKAVAGAGGRGIRVVEAADTLPFAYERAVSEARRAFGHGDVYVEEYLPHARHIEVQVVGDGTGEVVHLGDRDCSIQRRHQKVIEIAPSGLNDRNRSALLEAAVGMAKELRYAGLGTFEFLVDATDEKQFVFLEANPRVQVEHPVTEMVTGLDLVAIQLRIAQGETLEQVGLAQDSVPRPRGVAIECRVNLERLLADGSAAATNGTLEVFEPPGGPGVRVDTAGETGLATTDRFDSLLAKLIVWSPSADLADCARRTHLALSEFRIDGPETNLGLLQAIISHEDFIAGNCTTTFLDSHLYELLPATPEPREADRATGRVIAPMAGTVVAVTAEPGSWVNVGSPLVAIEAMKMEHTLISPVSGTVLEAPCHIGSVVESGALLVRIEADAEQGAADTHERSADLDTSRADLDEVLERHRKVLDESRPEPVAKRHSRGKRTARENVTDLVDVDTFTEYGPLVIAAQKHRRTLEDLIENTPADGMVSGIGRVDGVRTAVVAYDYSVLAGTQGLHNHQKTDRVFDIAARQQLPLVLFAEGGGGRPGDLERNPGAGLGVSTFTALARMSGRVPLVGIASGNCFAGNAALLACCDLIVATRDANIGMAGPAMIEGGGLGRFALSEIGPTTVQGPNGVIDVLVEDEAEAVEVVKRYLSYFNGPIPEWTYTDQRILRHLVPESRVSAYDMRAVFDALADTGSLLELRAGFGQGVHTALVRIEGRPLGLIGNNPQVLGGAIDAAAADKAARFIQLCDSHGLPVVSLVDTPGFMVGPEVEKSATVRHFARLFVVGANLTVPLVAVVVRKAYGLGAMAMMGGDRNVPEATVTWPTAEVGGMGREGAVRLGFRRELDAVEEEGARERLYKELLSQEYERGKAINVAHDFDVDDVIDPASTRTWIAAALPEKVARPAEPRYIDPW